MFEIFEAKPENLDALNALYLALGKVDNGYFENVFDKNCIVFVAKKDSRFIGFAILNFEPKYNLYRRLNIPEIQDLNVVSDYRRQGIGRQIIEACEQAAKNNDHDAIGISVGLTKDYGAAQRLYTKMGYLPDGNGITYDREGIEQGQLRAIDDNLCLMMMKNLN